MISDKLQKAINEQITAEMWSANLYLSMAFFLQKEGYDGCATWLKKQSQEEMDHAMIFRRYLLDNDVKPELLAIAQPECSIECDLDPLREGLKHEEYVTSLIDNCYAVAVEARDYRTMKLLDWFISEQGEEETNARDMVTNMELFGGDPKGLYALDREYQTRAYTAQTALPM